MNLTGAIIAGVSGTVVFSAVLALGPRVGMPPMDIVGLLATMFGGRRRLLGWMLHLMMGVLFAVGYAFVWSRGLLSPNWLGGVVIGSIHWLIVGLVMAMIPLVHAGIRSGAVAAPGLWMTNQGGALAFVSGLMGHIVYGLVVAVVYSAI